MTATSYSTGPVDAASPHGSLLEHTLDLHDEQNHQEGASTAVLEIHRGDRTDEASGCAFGIAGTQPAAAVLPTAAAREHAGAGSVGVAVLPDLNPDGSGGSAGGGGGGIGGGDDDRGVKDLEANELCMRQHVIASSIVGNLLEW